MLQQKKDDAERLLGGAEPPPVYMKHRSLFLFPPQSAFRRVVFMMAFDKKFEYVILALILVSSAKAGQRRPGRVSPNSSLGRGLGTSISPSPSSSSARCASRSSPWDSSCTRARTCETRGTPSTVSSSSPPPPPPCSHKDLKLVIVLSPNAWSASTASRDSTVTRHATRHGHPRQVPAADW